MSVEAPLRPVDLLHLARYTGGETSLDAEILKLFAGQAEQLIAKLRIHLDRADAKSWHDTLHSLKGAACGVGAFTLADLAAAAEPLDPGTQSREAGRAIEAMRSQAHAIKQFVEAFLSSIAPAANSNAQ